MIRAATAADAPLVADVLEMAARGHLPRGPWDFVFPESRERRAALRQIAGGDAPSWCHHAVFHVAEVDGVAGAALCCFEAETLGDTTLARPLGAVFDRLDWAPTRIGAIAPVLAPYLRCFPEFPPGHWIVENVGTRPDFRRRGLVARLLEHALETGRAQGWKTAQISCLLGNDAARRAYEKAGFAAVEERCDDEFAQRFGAPGFARLITAL